MYHTFLRSTHEERSVYRLAHPWQISIDGERFALEVLERMRREGAILDFVRTKRLVWSTKRGGIDFYLIVRGSSKRIIIPLSLRGFESHVFDGFSHIGDVPEGVREIEVALQFPPDAVRRAIERQVRDVIDQCKKP